MSSWCHCGFCRIEKWLFSCYGNHADTREGIISVFLGFLVASVVLRYVFQVQRRSVMSDVGTDSSAVIVAGTVGLECDVVETFMAAQI